MHHGVAGNHQVAVQAAQEVLLSGSSAVSAVLAGYFVACGAHAGVLLGPLTLLVAGVGSGVRAFDGRLRQPGLGTKRPRGFTESEEIPDAAFVAAPQSIAAAVVAHAYDRGGPIAEVVRRGIRQAKQVGAEARAEVLESVRSHGAKALSSTRIARPLLHAAGVSEGGLLTSADLSTVFDVDVAAIANPGAPDWMQAPWLTEQADGSPAESRVTPEPALDGETQLKDLRFKLIAAVDVRGVFAAAAYTLTPSGVSVDELELEAPRSAMPVLRGVTRINPGCPIPAPMPLAIQMSGGRPVAAVGDPDAWRLDAELIERAPIRVTRDPISRVVTTKN